jgi:hypothetical protein
MTPHEQSVPYGFCHCLCGGKTTIASRNHAQYGMVKGQPRKFIAGHRNPKPPEEAQPFKIDGIYCRLIPLTKGLHAIVDEIDYLWLMRYRWQAIPIGQDATGFYAANRNGLRMHQLIAGNGYDHANRVGIDNRRNNLRPASQRENVKNASKRKDNTSGFIGVHLLHGKYAALIQVDGKAIYLGSRPLARDAALLRDAAARKYHGKFAVLNFPNEEVDLEKEQAAHPRRRSRLRLQTHHS